MFIATTSLTGGDNDPDQLEKLYERYHALMYTIAFSILNQVEDAEDVAEEVFIRIQKHLPKLTDVASPRTKGFLTTVAKNVALNELKKKNRWSMHSYEELAAYVPSDEDLEDEIIGAAVYKEATIMLASLPYEYRVVLTFKYIYELNPKEIAILLGLTQATVRKRIERGLEKMRTASEEVKQHE